MIAGAPPCCFDAGLILLDKEKQYSVQRLENQQEKIISGRQNDGSCSGLTTFIRTVTT